MAMPIYLGGGDLFLDQSVYSIISAELTERFSTEKVKSVAKKLAGKNKDYYLSAGIKYEEVVKTIKEAASVKDIINALHLKYQKKY